MSEYPPPIEIVPIFNPLDYIDTNDVVTIQYADANYLKYPVAQGNETLNNTNVNGTLTVNSTTNLNSSVNIPNNDMFIRNIRVGYGAGNNDRNTIVGISSGGNNTTGTDNVFVGSLAGNQNTTGGSNVLIGSFSGRNLTTGGLNTFLGRDSGNNAVTSLRNVFVGRQAGYFNTGNENVFIGSDADAVGNISNSVAIGYNVKATANNTIVLGLNTQKTIVSGGADLGSNTNLVFPSGTGIINQSIPIGSTTQNILKRGSIVVDSGNASNGSAISGLEIFESGNGKGFYFFPNIAGGLISPLCRTNDAAMISRATQGDNSLCLTNWTGAGSICNGLRISTVGNTSATTGVASSIITCGVNNNRSEFAMTYDLSNNRYSTTFNYPINFNPTNIYGNFPSTRRLLSGLGTLHFIDISNNGILGRYESDIYTNSVSISGGIVGMYYDCGIPNGYHIFSATDSNNNVTTPIYYGSALTSVSNTFIVRNATTPSNRFDISVDTNQNINIRGRSATASTSAKINFNADAVAANGAISNLAVLSINPTNLEMRRPIQFNYITNPNSLLQLGYLDTLIFTSLSVSTDSNVRNYGRFDIINPGTYNVEILFGLTASGSHNLTNCVFGCDETISQFSSITTPTKYTSSLIGHNTISLSSTTTSYLKSNFNINFVTSNNTIYVNYLLTFSGGGTTTIYATGNVLRIG